MHYPEDRSFLVNIKSYILFIIGIVLIGSIVIAWIRYLFFGLPSDSSVSFSPVALAGQPSGFMVKWISAIEFVKTYKNIGKGYGGKNEDDEYFDLLADT